MGQGQVKKFRSRKLAQMQTEHTQETQKFGQAFMSLAGKVFEIDRKVEAVKPGLTIAKVADWRSLATMQLLEEAGIITVKQVIDRVMKLQEQHFDQMNAEDDARRGLTNADDQVAEKGMFAITTIKLFKNGTELEDQRIVRSKIVIGGGELLPELDVVLEGMKVGESKAFPIEIQGKTDTAEVLLLGLRKAPAPVAQPEAPVAEATTETSTTPEGQPVH